MEFSENGMPQNFDKFVECQRKYLQRDISNGIINNKLIITFVWTNEIYSCEAVM